jgi:hypothetical protein
VTYYYSDPSRESDPHARPDFEVFEQKEPGRVMGGVPNDEPLWEAGWYYAWGSVGCLWDSDPVGPFPSEQAAIEAAREESATG